MASNSRSSGTAALRYANALVDLAVQQGAAQAVERDSAELSAMISESEDLQFFLKSPLIGAKDAEKALSALAAKAGFSPLTVNFLLTLAENRRLSDTQNILKAVAKAFAARRGEIAAKVETAQALTPAQKQAIAEQLSKTIGRSVAIEETVNAALIGGVVVTMGSLLIDDSVRSKIERLGRGMKARTA